MAEAIAAQEAQYANQHQQQINAANAGQQQISAGPGTPTSGR